MRKETVKITREEADRMINKDFDFLAKTENQLLKDFYLETRCNLMRPVVIVEYEREAYIQPIGAVRVTFDTQLRTSLGYSKFFEENYYCMSTLEQKGIILEVKYNEVLPHYISGFFPSTISPQQAKGKFVICRNQQISQIGSNHLM
jgi:hypothetical protein